MLFKKIYTTLQDEFVATVPMMKHVMTDLVHSENWLDSLPFLAVIIHCTIILWFIYTYYMFVYSIYADMYSAKCIVLLLQYYK